MIQTMSVALTVQIGSLAAKRFEIGNYNYLGIIALSHSLDYINNIGIERIQQRIIDLSDYLVNGLLDLGVELVSPKEKLYRSGIVSFKTKYTNSLHRKLIQERIITSYRRGSIRVSWVCIIIRKT